MSHCIVALSFVSVTLYNDQLAAHIAHTYMHLLLLDRCYENRGVSLSVFLK